MKNREPLLENPFDYLNWIDNELLFAVILTKKKERILVGTKTGIMEHWARKDDSKENAGLLSAYNFECVRDCLPEEKTIKKVERFFVDFAVDGLMTAARNVGERQRYEDSVQIPLVNDRTYPIGHLLLEFERDYDKEWNKTISKLAGAMKIGKKKGASVEEAKDFLLEKWRSKDPVCQYTALSIWKKFCQTTDTEVFERFAHRLADSFWQNPSATPTLKRKKIAYDDPILRLGVNMGIGEDELRIWMLDSVGVECVVLKDSFYPLKLYYRLKMNEYGLKFCQCQVCGRYFASDTLRSTACGSSCGKVRKIQIKGNFEERNKGNPIEKATKRAKQTWLNRIKKMDAIEGFPITQKEEIKKSYEAFKKECGWRKREANSARSERLKIKDRTTSKEERVFLEWLFSQERQVQALMGEYEDRHDY